MADGTGYRFEMLCGIRQPCLVCGQRILMTRQTGVFQLVAFGRGAYVVRPVAVGAAQAGLAMYAAAIDLEYGIVTLAAWGSARGVISGFGHHRMRIVAVDADGRVVIALAEERRTNAALVQLEYRGVTGFTDLVQ